MLNRRLFLCGSMASLALPKPSIAGLASIPANFKLIAKSDSAQLFEKPANETQVWAYNGMVPGPVIKIKKGEPVRIEVFNQLTQPTSIHWHGLRIDNAMDGVSYLTQEPIQPGESFIYEFTPPDAGTYWYHPHNRTWEQLARGLYGTLIVEGDSSDDAFDRDYSIIADDWRLKENGSFDEESLGNLHDWSHAGRLGNVLTLNGKPYEQLDVLPNERVRLRFINTSNARTLRFGIGKHQPWLVALDGQPIEPGKLKEEGIEIAPAQRADLVVDIKGKPGDKIPIIEMSGSEGLIAGYLNCQSGSRVQRQQGVPTLKKNSIPKPNTKSAKEIDLLMSGGAMRLLTKAVFKGVEIDGRKLAREHQQVWAFNGQAGMSDNPFFVLSQGETIKLKLLNETAWPHAIHLHGHHFEVLSRSPLNSRELIPISDHEKTAYRDTVLVNREEVVEVAFVADNPGKWMLHCHMLEHQASGMGTWFKVV